MSENLEALSIDQLRAVLDVRQEAVAGGWASSVALDTEYPTAGAPPDPGAGGIILNDPLPGTSSESIFNEIRSRQKAIYGDDDRIEVLQADDPERRRVARSVAAIIRASEFMALDSTRTSVSPTSLSDKYQLKGMPLCQREPFRTQPASAIGTAFLIGPKTVATAHHCINEDNFDRVCLVFDFELSEQGDASTEFPVDQVYSIRRFIGGKFTQDAEDWSVVELDREVFGRDPLPFRTNGKAPDGTALYVVGHPLGLPKKIAGNAQIRVNSHDNFFVANLDTYGGNSGSPVFNAMTHEVEGILVRGHTDFAPLGNCYASLVCPVGGCRGEDCSRTALLGDLS